MARSVGVVLPAYRPDVDRLADYVRDLDDRLDPATIRIELDAPEPGVVERLQSLQATVNVAPDRRGKGAAITAGFEALDTDVVAFADADGSTPAGSMADVLAPVERGNADLAVGSRRHPDATVTTHQTVVRRYMGDVFARVARTVLDVDLYDFQCGAKAMSREAWTTVRAHLYESGFAWDFELIAVAATRDCRIVEVPVVWEDRAGSTVSPIRTPAQLLRAMVAVRRRVRRSQYADTDLDSGSDFDSNPTSEIDDDPRPLIDRLAAGDE